MSIDKPFWITVTAVFGLCAAVLVYEPDQQSGNDAAFARAGTFLGSGPRSGMTIRTYLAAEAMSGVAARVPNPTTAAELAVQMADALPVELAREEGQ